MVASKLMDGVWSLNFLGGWNSGIKILIWGNFLEEVGGRGEISLTKIATIQMVWNTLERKWTLHIMH
jgi:hypothetical protein